MILNFFAFLILKTEKLKSHLIGLLPQELLQVTSCEQNDVVWSASLCPSCIKIYVSLELKDST